MHLKITWKDQRNGYGIQWERKTHRFELPEHMYYVGAVEENDVKVLT
jgi:hypothetical protein